METTARHTSDLSVRFPAPMARAGRAALKVTVYVVSMVALAAVMTRVQMAIEQTPASSCCVNAATSPSMTAGK